jgi:hypothetical protein
MFCPSCGANLPPQARFCLQCGQPVSPSPAPAAPAPSAVAPAAPSGPVELKCQSCGAPLKPLPGEMVVTCEYCGTPVALSRGAWKAIQNHSMLVPKVNDEQAALEVCRSWLDRGLLKRHLYEESTLKEAKLSVVPFWVIPVSAVTHYVYNDVAVQAAEVGGSLAAAAVVGSLLGGGRRGGFGLPLVMGMGMGMGMGGAGAASQRAGELAGQYEYPVIAVQGLQKYQPHDYTFDLSDRQLFDRRRLPPNATVLNGDVGEEAAAYSARNYVTQLQAEKVHQQHRMIERLQTQVNTSDGELLHVPIWYFTFEHKGETTILLVDAHRMAVMNSVT